MAGIDVDEVALQQAAERTEPTFYEHVVKRPHPLTISLHRGSICSPAHTRQLLRAAHVAVQEVGGSSSEADGEQVEEEDWDAIALVEVIEHLEPHDLPAMEASVFGRCRPRYVVVTTPNYEFNVVFNDPLGAHIISSKRARPDTTYATSSSSSFTPSPTTSRLPFRHYDHKFEWTRAEFEEWCNAVANRYGYRYTLSGVGTRQSWTSGTDHAEEEREGGGEEEDEEEKESALARPAASSKRKCPTSPGVEGHKKHDDGEEDDDVGFCTQIAYFTRLEDDDRTTPNEEAESTAAATEEPLQLCAVHSFPVDTRSDTEKLAAAVAYAYGHVVVGSEGELEYGDWVSVADRLLPLPPVRESCGETASPDRLRAELRAIAAEPSRYFGLEYDEATDRVRIAAYDSDEDEEEPPADDGGGGGGPLFLENESEGDSRRSNQAAAERPSPVWAAGEEDGAWGQSWGDSWDHE